MALLDVTPTIIPLVKLEPNLLLTLFGNGGIDENAIVGKLSQLNKALNALDVQIVAIPQEMKIRIAVPLEFITIEQTSGCSSDHAYDHSVPFFVLI